MENSISNLKAANGSQRMAVVPVSGSTSLNEASTIRSSSTCRILSASPLLGSISSESDTIPSMSPLTVGSHSSSSTNCQDGMVEAEVSKTSVQELQLSATPERKASVANASAGGDVRKQQPKTKAARNNSREEVLQELQLLQARLREAKYRPLLQRLTNIKEERPQKDEEAVRKLRAMLKEKGMLPPELDEYHALLRFIKFCRYNMRRAAAMWAVYVQWRGDNDIDGVLAYEYAEQFAVQQAMTGTHHGVDRQGRPVFWELTGRQDTAKLLTVTTFDRYIRYKFRDIIKSPTVRLPACSVAAGKDVTGVVIVVDAHTLGFKNFTAEAFSILRLVGKLDTEYFPEVLQGVFVVNANAFLRYSWNTLKLFLDDSTLSKFQVLGADYHETLFKHIDPSQVPDMFGGACQCDVPGGCLFSDVGPWSDPDVLRVVHLMRKGQLDVPDPRDISSLGTVGRISWQCGEWKVDGESVGGRSDQKLTAALSLSGDEDSSQLASQTIQVDCPSLEPTASSSSSSSEGTEAWDSGDPTDDCHLARSGGGRRGADRMALVALRRACRTLLLLLSAVLHLPVYFLQATFCLLALLLTTVTRPVAVKLPVGGHEVVDHELQAILEERLSRIEKKIDSLHKHASFKSLQVAIEEEERKVETIQLGLHDSKMMLDSVRRNQDQLLDIVEKLAQGKGVQRGTMAKTLSLPVQTHSTYALHSSRTVPNSTGKGRAAMIL